MYHDECAELLTLPDKHEEEYKLFASVLEFVMNDDYANLYYGSQYPELLHGLLETDADINAELYQIVCAPHATGKYADGSTYAKSFERLFAGVPKQNEHLTGEDIKQARESLSRLKGTRDNRLGELNSSGVFEAYNARHNSKE